MSLVTHVLIQICLKSCEGGRIQAECGQQRTSILGIVSVLDSSDMLLQGSHHYELLGMGLPCALSGRGNKERDLREKVEFVAQASWTLPFFLTGPRSWHSPRGESADARMRSSQLAARDGRDNVTGKSRKSPKMKRLAEPEREVQTPPWL